jgi:hypothetical protein
LPRTIGRKTNRSVTNHHSHLYDNQPINHHKTGRGRPTIRHHGNVMDHATRVLRSPVIFHSARPSTDRPEQTLAISDQGSRNHFYLILVVIVVLFIGLMRALRVVCAVLIVNVCIIYVRVVAVSLRIARNPFQIIPPRHRDSRLSVEPQAASNVFNHFPCHHRTRILFVFALILYP